MYLHQAFLGLTAAPHDTGHQCHSVQFDYAVKPVLRDHPLCYKKVVLHDRWSFMTGSFNMEVIGPGIQIVDWSVMKGWSVVAGILVQLLIL